MRTPASSVWIRPRPISGDAARAVSWARRRPPLESSISFASRRSCVSARFALTTQWMAVCR